MLLSLKWLNEYVKVDDLDPQFLADQLTLHSVEVDAVNPVSDATKVIIGHVTEKSQHPDADKLSVCQVDIGSETLQIVCGAANVDAGQKVPVAVNGAVLPGGFEIKQTEIRGMESNGMICSASELGIESHHVPDRISDGIWILPEDAPVGECAIGYLGLDDVVLELGLTPNRMDMLSMYGIANDVAAVFEKAAAPVLSRPEFNENLKGDFAVTLKTKKCSHYLAKVVNDVTVAPSDLKTEMKLMATGNKPISNFVDLTNELMLTTGLPVHAFDADKLPAKEITVREAKDGEEMVTLDGQTRKLVAGDVVITSGGQIVALAGIMGSLDSGIDENTTNVVFEAAIFDPAQIRKTATRLNLRTNASARFEKGIHIERIYEVNGILHEKFPAGVDVVAGDFTAEQKTIEVTLAAINGRLGTDLEVESVSKILSRLNLNFEIKGETFTVEPNTRMRGVNYAHDIIEEVGRIYGFENIPGNLPMMNTVGGYTAKQQLLRKVHRQLQASGLQNVLTYSLVDEGQKTDSTVSLAMPLSKEHSYLRGSLVPSLLEVTQYNNARQIKDVFIYEIGNKYEAIEEGHNESLLITGAITGEIPVNKWQSKVEKVDFYMAKGIVDGLFEALNLSPEYKAITGDYKDFHPGQTAQILIDGQPVGIIGKIHPLVGKKYDLEDTFVFELEFEVIKSVYTGRAPYEYVSKFPGVAFDLALIVKEDIAADSLVQTIKETGESLVTDAHVFDVYQGTGVEAGHKSIAINITCESKEATLTDEIIQDLREKLLKALKDNFDATLRS